MNPDPVVNDYGWRTATPAHTHSYLLPRIRDLLRSMGAKRVLDLGCGNGAMCASLAEAGFEVVGLENDAAGIEIARANHPEIRFHQISIEGNPRKLLALEPKFDAVVSTEVIEHLFSPHLLPQFASAVLHTSGFLMVTTPYHGYLKNLALSLADKWDHHHTALWHGGHIKFWSRKTLTRLLGDNGFSVVAFHGVGRMPWLWKSMVVIARPVSAAGFRET